MSDERAREIANRLNAEQRLTVRTGYGTHKVVTSWLVEPLWTDIRKLGHDHFSIGLNSNGLAVRRILEEGNNANA